MSDKISELEKEIELQISILKKQLLKNVNNEKKYINKLQKNLQFIEWVNRKFRISIGGRKYTVAQKEIYNCDLGINIGSEQSEYRPVVVLQNNFGNKSGNTTIIAPITSHEKSVKYDQDKKKYYIEVTCQDGTSRIKYLDYYEAPITIENGYKQQINGFVNVAHIKEIDRKRICSTKLAIVTNGCFKDIRSAILKNLR
ncbi:MAG: type II toxin-antitoxin system PemK/MazF family toxin [Eubacterium sp.]|nr:type II toxin-antitoxin system PemK/MazF family toxin [Eubacterium sp.]